MNPFSIPTGLHPSAPGCEERATLGNRPNDFPNPEGVAAPGDSRWMQPFQGCDGLRGLPRVAARTRQPWDDGYNPRGVARVDGHLKKMGAVWT